MKTWAAMAVWMMVVGGCADSRSDERSEEMEAGGMGGTGGSGAHSGSSGSGSGGGGECTANPLPCGNSGQPCCSDSCGDVSPCNGESLLCCADNTCAPDCPFNAQAGVGGVGGSGGMAGTAGSGGSGHTPSDCLLPFDGGQCDAFQPRYGFRYGRCQRFIYGGCDGNANRFSTIEDCEETCEVECEIDATDASLPGVTVHVEGDHCTLVGGEGGEFRYTIEVEDPIEYTQPASVGCGPCGADPLVSFEIGEGPVFYNERDVGCCPPLEEDDKTLASESITGTIDWPGVQWRGPSDTSQPYGPAFPWGEYTVRVTINVPGKGAVTAELPITVVAGDATQEGIACLGPEYAYPSGDTTFPDPTSCNTCLCEDGMVSACTEIGCEMPCPDGTAVGTDCGHCSITSMGCDILRTACLPTCTTGDACTSGICGDGVCKNLCD